MSNIKKLMMSGATGGAALDITDVFSTYLYSGNSSGQAIDNGIALADGLGGGTSTQFSGNDGNNLRRTSDFSGNSDSKTFTFSAWVLRGENVGQHFIYSADDGTYAFSVSVKSGGDVVLAGWNGTSRYLQATQAGGNLPVGSWFHLLISIDLSSSSNRYVYINDVNKTSQFSWQTYSNDPIEFTRSNHNIGQQAIYAGVFKGNLAHVYLDYTYRNLSTTSNRRLFIGADGGSTSPSTLSALNPIMYLPMTEDYSLGENLGTGGDLGVNGPPTIVNKGTEYLSGFGEGGLWWLKVRSQAGSNLLYDSTRATGSEHFPLFSNTNGAEYDDLDTTPTPTGFTINSSSSGTINQTGVDYVSWTFRKAPKFFDAVTYTGDNTARTISHNLGTTPGLIIVKCTSGNGHWRVWHRSLANGASGYLNLNRTDAELSSTSIWNNTLPTDSVFSLGTSVNESGLEYVAYLFAHNDGDGGFGPDGSDIIKCGSYTGNGGKQSIDLGFEPQWLLIKRTNGSEDWHLMDTMRGMPVEASGSPTKVLEPNDVAAEIDPVLLYPYANGFTIDDGNLGVNNSGDNYIYMAIRRGPLAPPETGTEVFDIYQNESTATVPAFKHPFPVDFAVYKAASNTEDWWYSARPVPGQNYRFNVQTYAGTSSANPFDYMDGWVTSSTTQTDYHSWAWKRAPQFFDIVTYSGTNSVQNVPHNLGVAPKLMIIRMLEQNAPPVVYWGPAGNTNSYFITSTSVTDNSTFWNDTSPTDSVFTVKGPLGDVNYSGYNYMALLFGEIDGISKIGSYVGNGSTQNIDCGFSSGARFVLIKGSTSGDWITFDTERGIVAGDDPYLRWNNGGAEITNRDFIDPHSSGFTVNTDTATLVNASGTTYYFYAIA